MRTLGIVVLLALGGVIAQGLVAVARSPALKLEEYEISGNSRVPQESIIEVAGVEPGEHLLTVSTSSIAERLLMIPWIRKARVERILPSTLRITVVERTAQLVVQTAAGPYLVDGQGLVLQAGSEDLVPVSGLAVTELTPGDRIDEPAFEHAWKVYRELPDGVISRVVSISALSVDQIKFNLNGGPELFYGAAESIELKNRAVEAMLREVAGGNEANLQVDVRVPERPVVRPR